MVEEFKEIAKEVAAIDFGAIKDYSEIDLSMFHTEPINQIVSELMLNESRPSKKDAMQINLSKYILLDLLWRWRNAGDGSINIRGAANTSKSNAMLYYSRQWAKITDKPFRLSNIAFSLPEFNLLLKGMKVKQVEGGITIENFELEPGIALCLDEAGDTLLAGPLSLTTALQTSDLEKRMRARQILRVCAGVGEIMHSAYYGILMIQRDPMRKLGTGLIYVNSGDSREPFWLGRVEIPYVKKEVFDAYMRPKMQSITDYAHSVGVNRISQLMDFFANELKSNEVYQKLPMKPVSERINWIQRQPRYTCWPTISYFSELEKLSRNPELHKKLSGQGVLKMWSQDHPDEEDAEVSA